MSSTKWTEATIESVSGPKTLCVSVLIGEVVYPRFLLIDGIVPRDPVSCEEFLEELVGKKIIFKCSKINRIGQYVSEIEVDELDLAEEMIKRGIAD